MLAEALGVFAEEFSFGVTFVAICFSRLAAATLGALPANLGPSSIADVGTADFLAVLIRFCYVELYYKLLFSFLN